MVGRSSLRTTVRAAIVTFSVALVAVGVARAMHSHSKGQTVHLLTAPAAATANAATTSTRPDLSALPAGAAIVSTETVPANSFPGTTGPAHALTTISLPGVVNAAINTDGRAGPATTVGVNFVSGVTSLPPVESDSNLFAVKTTSVAGHAARSTTTAAGDGVVKLEWIDADGYHEILCDRLQRPTGLSGITAAQEMSLAESLYQS